MTEPVTQQPPQWTPMNVAAATPQQLVAAVNAGQLTDMGMPAQRSGRRHDRDGDPTARILAETTARQAARAAATEKARTAPASLTDADIPHLAASAVTSLVESGGLAHLGIGTSRARRS